MRTTLAVAAMILAANHVSAQAPTLKLVNGINKDKGEIIMRESVIRTVFVEKAIVEIVNGQMVTRTVRETVPVSEERLVTMQLANARVISADGKQMPIDEVWKKLKANTVVAVAGANNTPGQAYLRALNPETLVIIAPVVTSSPMVVVPPQKLPPPAPKKAP
jgi:hypothetical protein